jgi:hypothetical protein
MTPCMILPRLHHDLQGSISWWNFFKIVCPFWGGQRAIGPNVHNTASNTVSVCSGINSRGGGREGGEDKALQHSL